MIFKAENANYLLYGTDSCILDKVKGKTGTSYEIPEMIDGLLVVGFNENFVRSLKNVKTLKISRYISQFNVDSGHNLMGIFKGCHWTSIEVAPENESLKSVEGVLFSKQGDKLLLYPPSKNDDEYRIPDGVESIAKYAFSNNPHLKRLSFSASIDVIKETTLYSCLGLTRVDICGKETVLQGDPFYSCDNLAEIRFPYGSSVYQERNGVIYTRCKNMMFMLYLFPPAMHLKHYVVPPDTAMISNSALRFLSALHKVHIPKKCRLPYIVKGASFCFYNPLTQHPSVPDDHKQVGYEPVDKIQKMTVLERLFSKYGNNGNLVIPTYKDYLELVSTVLVASSRSDLALLESVKVICLPTDMETVDLEFFTKFINLAAIRCEGDGTIHAENNVLYEGDTIIFYPPFCKVENLSIKKERIHVGAKAFYHNKFLVNLILDSPQISISNRSFECALKFQNLVIKGKINGLGMNAFAEIGNNLNIIIYGTIYSCAPNAFGNLKGTAEILVLTMTEKDKLRKTIKKGDCIVKLITHQQMVDHLERISKKYNIYMKWIPKRTQVSPTTHTSTVEKLPRNTRVEIKVFGHRFACMNKHHHLVTKTVSLDMIDATHNYRTVNIDVGYCLECKNYFVYSNVFRTVQDKIEYSKWRLIGANFYIPGGRSYGYILESCGDLRKESILKISGYSVGQSSNLTSSQRISILTDIIKRNWLTKQGVMSYLNWFIDFHGHNPSMQWAVNDWKSDLKELQKIKI